jgi:hypothetical protein
MNDKLSIRDIRETTRLIIHLTKKLSESGIFPLSIPIGSSAKSLLSAGHFNLAVGPELVHGMESAFLKEVAPLAFVKLFSLPKGVLENLGKDNICKDFVSSLIIPFSKNRRGYRNASIVEILALGAQYPELQKHGPIVGLGDGFRWDEASQNEPIKYPRLTAIKYPNRVSRVFDWLDYINQEELGSLRIAMVVK